MLRIEGRDKISISIPAVTAARVRNKIEYSCCCRERQGSDTPVSMGPLFGTYSNLSFGELLGVTLVQWVELCE